MVRPTQNKNSHWASAPAQESDETRINKYLAMQGVSTRRDADKLILAGKVTINGRRAILGDKVVAGDKVEVQLLSRQGAVYEHDVEVVGFPPAQPVG